MTAVAGCEVDFQPTGKRVEVAAGIKLIEAARAAGIALASACGACGTCGQCRVTVMGGAVSPPTANEEHVLGASELAAGRRLACSTRVLGALKVHIPDISLLTAHRLQIDGDGRSSAVQPAVRAFDFAAPSPALDDPRADLERIAAALAAAGAPPGIVAEPAVMCQISSTARAHHWDLAAYLRGHEIIALAPRGTQPLGMAVDLGTTKIAAYLLDLASGEELAAAGALNPQIAHGEDVISRLAHVRRDPGGAAELAGLVRGTLDDTLGALLARAGAPRERVAEICIVGNTAMIHLLLGLPVAQLAMSPYVPATAGAIDVRARALGIAAAPGAWVHVLPCIGGFVGADHVAMILASGLDAAREVVVGIDIGTNTEIAIACPGAPLAAASCASGPAFEGAHIGDGMRAAAGAIEAVRLGAGGVELRTVGDAPPVGLCGSGIVDAVAELRRAALINTRGRFARDDPRVRAGRQGPEFVLAPAASSGSGRDVVITQADVNQVQLAKGAIRAGLDALLELTGTAPQDVAEVLIAGAFGSFLDIGSAHTIGLFPELPRARYRQIGNAAGTGAKWALASTVMRARARHIASTTRYVELTTFARFSRFFAHGMLFPP